MRKVQEKESLSGEEEALDILVERDRHLELDCVYRLWRQNSWLDLSNPCCKDECVISVSLFHS